MRGAHDNTILRLCFSPAIQGTTAGKHQRMQRAAFNYGKLKITVKRRGRNIFPY
jgi:hypothetical protein